MNTIDTARGTRASVRRLPVPNSARLGLHLSSLRSLLTLCALCVLFASPARAEDILTADATAWRCLPSDGVEASISTDSAASSHGPCLRLDFNFKSGGGFVVVQRDLAIDLPENYQFYFDIKADENTRPNNLEFKLLDNGQPTDPKANSVWWVIRRGMEFPRDWSHISYKKRHFSFAWGPSGGAPLTHLAHLEFAISSAEGGKGTIWFDGLTFKETPPVRPYTGTPTASATDSFDAEHGPEKAIDGSVYTSWEPRTNTASITVDFGQVREFGGLRLDWSMKSKSEPGAPAAHVQFSSDGKQWTDSAVSPELVSQTSSFLFTPDSEARYVRISPPTAKDANPDSLPLCRIAGISLIPIDQAKDWNAFIATMAKDFPRGEYPRWAYGEQSFWTVLGAPSFLDEALINEDGQVEMRRGRFLIDPFVDGSSWVTIDRRSVHSSEVFATPSLLEGDLPIATISRRYGSIGLDITSWVDWKDTASVVVTEYAIRNEASAISEGTLDLRIRPFQVNPPAQFLNLAGGVGRINELNIGPLGARIDQVHVRWIPVPDDFDAATFAQGDAHPLWRGEVLRKYAVTEQTPATVVRDPQGMASGFVSYHYKLEPGASKVVYVSAQLGDSDASALLASFKNDADFVKSKARVANYWRGIVHQASLSLPPSAKAIEDTFYAQQAYILINKVGPGFQPGSRSYERSWMRDGSMTSAAMLQLGYFDLVKEFVAWYASFQFPDGKVPCVVDKRGPDPVPENDSHGELIMAIANVHRYTHDDAFVKAQFGHVKKAVEYIEKLRQERMTPEYSTVPGEDGAETKQEPGKPAVPYRAFYGLLPESISHEGYSAKPMHSYWDDLFAYRGLKDAVYCAKVVGDTDDLIRWEGLAKDFGETLTASYALTMKTHDIDYLPGCVELGDFDATSTTVALWPVQAQDILPHAALVKTFDKYWDFFTHRRDEPRDQWEAYTPYELRTINAMVHLGERDRAVAALEWFMKDQYPPGWHHWAEVVWSNPRTTKFIGDMPHTWVGSDFLNSLRSMFVYEDEAHDALVVFAGVPEKWVREGDGVSFRNFRTYYGPLSATARGDGDNIAMTFDGDLALPKGGLVVRSVLGKACSKVLVDGHPVREVDGGITLHAMPREIEWRP